jgi:Lar family restriction alleviation protein
MSTDLKPCPFCGGKAEIIEDMNFIGEVGIECQNCFIQFTAPTHDKRVIDEKGYMITMWNRRTSE